MSLRDLLIGCLIGVPIGMYGAKEPVFIGVAIGVLYLMFKELRVEN